MCKLLPALSTVPVEPVPVRRRILLVEDNEDNRIIYSTVLRHVGYDVLEAEDGEQALKVARESRPDLILMDISIPKIDGWEATRTLRREKGLANVPIIALTAHALPDDRDKAALAGFSAYLAKPVEPRVVVA